MSSQLGRLLAPQPEGVLYESMTARRYFHLCGQPGKFDHLLRVEDLDRFLQSEQLSSAFLRVVSAGEFVPKEKWTQETRNSNETARVAVPERLLELYGGGATVIVDQADRSVHPLLLACRFLATEMGFRIGANIYLTPASSQGFARHSDDHDVLVLQISGSKTWFLYPDGNEISLKMQTGDLLFIPSLMAHEARCDQSASIHVTLGLYPIRLHHLVEQFARIAATHPDFQLPILNPENRKEIEHQYLAAARRLVDECKPSLLFESQRDEMRKSEQKGWANRLTDTLLLPDICLDSTVCIRPHITVSTLEDGNTLSVNFSGKTIRIALLLKPCLDRILTPIPFNIKDLRGLVTDEGKVELVREFVQAGLLQVVRQPNSAVVADEQ